MDQVWDRLIEKEGKLYTLDLLGGAPVYGEALIDVDGNKYREWVPWRSKLGALLKKGERPPLDAGSILYLGAADGTTVSHLSDLLPGSMIYAVEFSPVPFRKLARIAKARGNIVPILEDAFHPERYAVAVGTVDLIYQDVSQKDQLGLFLRNSTLLSKERAVIMVKSRSIDVTGRPEDIFKEFSSRLRSGGFEVSSVVDLSPFQEDHAALLIGDCGKKKH